jgi:hypothetical protein
VDISKNNGPLTASRQLFFVISVGPNLRKQKKVEIKAVISCFFVIFSIFETLERKCNDFCFQKWKIGRRFPCIFGYFENFNKHKIPKTLVNSSVLQLSTI